MAGDDDIAFAAFQANADFLQDRYQLGFDVRLTGIKSGPPLQADDGLVAVHFDFHLVLETLQFPLQGLFEFLAQGFHGLHGDIFLLPELGDEILIKAEGHHRGPLGTLVGLGFALDAESLGQGTRHQLVFLAIHFRKGQQENKKTEQQAHQVAEGDHPARGAFVLLGRSR